MKSACSISFIKLRQTVVKSQYTFYCVKDIPRFVRVNEIIHELYRVAYLPYNRTNRCIGVGRLGILGGGARFRIFFFGGGGGSRGA